jgi:hypothetical protein
MTEKKYPEGIAGESKYVEYDDESGMYCIFGLESGHAYSSFSDEKEAKEYLENH